MEDTKGSDRFMSVNIALKHRIRLWATLRWTIFIVACLFAVGYVGILMLVPPINNLQRIYPDFMPQLGFYIHAFPGSIWLILGALQFFSFIRAKNPKAHRVMGIISLLCVLVSIGGGLIIVASGKAEGRRSLEIFGVFFFASWIVCCVLGWYYMRYQANIDKHREWMLRAYVLSYAIVLMRPGVLLYLYTPVTELVRYFGRHGNTSAKMQAMNLPGTVALAIKRYEHGAMSSWLHDSVKIGDTVEMMGSSGGFYYTPNQYRSLGLVAGGTGITPLLSIVMAVMTNPSDQTTIKLLYAASSEQDIMFEEELEQLARQIPHKLSVKFVAGSGRVTQSLLREYLPAPNDAHLVALCGPVGFCTTVQDHLTKLQFEEHTVFTFGETDH